MATDTVTSGCNTELSLMYSCRNKDTRDASFSSYLKNIEDTFVLELAEPTRNRSPLILTPREPPSLKNLGRKKMEYGEISVFGAEKYFNGTVDEEKPTLSNKSERKQPHKKDELVDSPRIRRKVKSGTPSATSESSWNSKSVLLPSLTRNLSIGKQNKVHGKKIFTSFGCNCPCSDKKSVDINETSGESNYKKNGGFGGVHDKDSIRETIKIDRNPLGLVQIMTPESTPEEEGHCQKFDGVGVGPKRGECFTFPNLNSGVENQSVGKHFLEDNEEEKPRKSLEVFGLTAVETEAMALNLDRRLTMLAWDVTPKMEDIPPISDDDTGSVASSDLFEINSISGSSQPLFTRQASDGMSSRSCVTTHTTIYEPSEASIEWSVVTASAANFSTASDYDDHKTEALTVMPKGSTTQTITKTKTVKTAIDKEVPRRRPSLLLGCRSHKAVKVAGDAYMINEKTKSIPRRHHRSDSFTTMARFQAETKLTEFNSVDNPHLSRSFARSYSVHASKSLYMH